MAVYHFTLRAAEVEHAGFNSPTLWGAPDKIIVLPSFCNKRLNTSRALPRGSLFTGSLPLFSVIPRFHKYFGKSIRLI